MPPSTTVNIFQSHLYLPTWSSLFQMKTTSASLSFSLEVFWGGCYLYDLHTTLMLVLNFGSVPLCWKKMSQGTCQHLDPNSPEEADQHPSLIMAWGVLSVFSSCNGWPRRKDYIQISLECELRRAWEFMFAFLIQVLLSWPLFLWWITYQSLLNENVQNQVDESCGGGICYISFLLTVKERLKEMRDGHIGYKLGFHWEWGNLCHCKSVNLKVILEWEERGKVTCATSWDNENFKHGNWVLAFLTDSCHLPSALTWRPLTRPFSFYLQFKSYSLPAVISKSGFSLFCTYPFVREGRGYALNINYADNKPRLPYYIKDGLWPIKPNRCHFPN